MAGKNRKKKQVHLKTPFLAHKPSSAAPPCANPEVISPSLPSGEPIHGLSPTHPLNDAAVKVCRHRERGVNIDKLSSKLSKAKFIITHCQDCANKESKSGAGKKGKGRSNRKKAVVVTEQSAPHLQKKWVCLACGHVACGPLLPHSSKTPEQQESGVENGKQIYNKGAPMGHASRHSLCANHPLALQVADTPVFWCFTCNMAVGCNTEGSSQLASSSSPLQEALKIVHEKLSKEKGFLKDPGKREVVGDLVRFSVDDASQSNSTLVLPPSPPVNMHMIGTRRKRTVKGLMNLGNTCFFNSVMQNLLALDMLRDYFSQDFLDGEGPLTSSLRKLYLETNPDGGGQLSTSTDASGYESGLKKGGKGRAVWEMNGGTCNPRSLFAAICAKAPRFRGFQQQDSHELLRCLLDGLSLEERSAKARSTCNGRIIKGASALVTNQVLISNGDCSNPESLERERDDKSAESKSPTSVATTTIVESFFGGQLCSTVRCCECGHSSVVYETMLDLSLQIPTQPTLKKGQKSANQWKPSSFGGAPQQRDGPHTKVPSKASLGKVCNASSVVGTNKSSLQVGLSPQPSQTYTSTAAKASSPKLALMGDSSSFDDVWLDFIGTGVQSAESSIQGSADVPNAVEISENNLVASVEAGDALKTASNASNLANVGGDQDKHKAESALPGDASDGAMPSADVQVDKLCVERLGEHMSKNSEDKEVFKPLAHSEGEDGPLPLASGVLLLPYEPLVVSSTPKEEESSASTYPVLKCSLMDTTSLSLEVEGDFDGFSQLFEEEESCSTVTKNVKPLGGNLEDNQVVEESSWDDGGWEADTVVSGRGQAAAGPERLATYEDTILPRSLEGCLADFTKPELLCGENAWECENCTRRLKEKGKSCESMNNFVSAEVICGIGGDGKKALAEVQNGEEGNGMPVSTAGNCPQEDSEMCHIENGNTDQDFQEDCESLKDEFIESVKGRPSVSAVLDHKVEGKQNGRIHFTNIDSARLCHRQSLLSQPDSSLNIIAENQHITERAANIIKSERDNETGTEDTAGNETLCVFDADPHVAKEAQEDCSSLDPTHIANSSKEEQNSPLRESVKEAKCKTKSKQHPEKLVKKDATKKLSISKAPLILTVHLKRFAQDMRGRLSKLNGHVSFPELLDLRPFLDPRCLDSNSCYYQLVGVVEHGGTMRGGHYIAYVRCPGIVEETGNSTEHEINDFWYYVSDSSVRKTSLQAVLNSEAYLLFYEKCVVKKAD